MGLPVLLFLFFFSLYSLTMQGVPTGGDAWGMFLVTESLVEDRDIFLDASGRVVLRQGRDGRWVSKYGIGQSLAEIPAYLLAKPFASRTKTISPENMLYFVTSFTSPFLSAMICVVVFLLCARMGYTLKAALAAAMLVGLGSLVWPQSKSLFSEPLQGFCLAAGFYFLYSWRRGGGSRRALPAGFFIGLMAAAKPFLILAIPPLAIYFLGGLRKRPAGKSRLAPAALFAGALAFWCAVILYYNWARFGSVFEFGYLSGADRDAVHGFRLPLLVGLHGLLFSSGKGLIFYVPAVVLLVFAFRPFAGRHPAEAWAIAAVFAIFVISYSKWNAWHGDFSWGPRFLAPVAPLLLIPLCGLFDGRGFFGRTGGRIVLAGIFLVSIFIQVLGSVVSCNEFFIITKSQAPFQIFARPNRVELRDDLLNAHYVPEFSPIAGHYWLLKHTVPDGGLSREQLNDKMRRDFPWKGTMPYAAPYDPGRGAGYDAWWFYFVKFFPAARLWVGPLAGVFAGMFLLSGGALAAAAVKYRIMRETDQERTEAC